jgi:hypothetical protein
MYRGGGLAGGVGAGGEEGGGWAAELGNPAAWGVIQGRKRINEGVHGFSHVNTLIKE